MKISQAINWLKEIQSREGDIELLRPDGRPARKFDVVGPREKALHPNDERGKPDHRSIVAFSRGD